MATITISGLLMCARASVPVPSCPMWIVLLPFTECPEDRAWAIVPVPSFLCLQSSHRARAIVCVPEPSCLCHRACANVPVPEPSSRAIVPVPSCLCQRACVKHSHRMIMRIADMWWWLRMSAWSIIFGSVSRHKDWSCESTSGYS